MKQRTLLLNRATNDQKKISKIALEIIVAILLIIWLHTSVSKIIDFISFRIQLYQSPLPIVRKFSKYIAYGVPGLEILISILLIIKKSRLAGMISSLALMLIFTVYVIYLMATAPKLPCSCGGVVGWLNWPQHLALNIFLTIIAGGGIILLKREKIAASQFK